MSAPTALVAHPEAGHGIQSIELEVTGACQLTCTHCLSSSSPQGTHGTMTPADWKRVISEAAVLGVPAVQLIGGEPTTHPHWIELVDHALSHGQRVEVYTNLFRLRAEWWDVLAREGVTLATSYYSDSAEEHDRITRRPGSYLRTRAHLASAVGRGIPVRVGIVETFEGQRVDGARAEVEAMGVTKVTVDRMRAVGRAADGADPRADELCGRCGQGRAAILPNGDLTLCVMARFMPCGNVREQQLAELIGSEQWHQALGRVPAMRGGGCSPDDQSCQPGQPACLPKFPIAPPVLPSGGPR